MQQSALFPYQRAVDQTLKTLRVPLSFVTLYSPKMRKQDALDDSSLCCQMDKSQKCQQSALNARTNHLIKWQSSSAKRSYSYTLHEASICADTPWMFYDKYFHFWSDGEKFHFRRLLRDEDPKTHIQSMSWIISVLRSKSLELNTSR